MSRNIFIKHPEQANNETESRLVVSREEGRDIWEGLLIGTGLVFEGMEMLWNSME